MNTVIVTVETAAGGFRATARRGTKEREASATSPELAARLAVAGLFGVELSDVAATWSAPHTWKATIRHGALVPQALP